MESKPALDATLVYEFVSKAHGNLEAIKELLEREPALITFLVTASGVSLLGIGSAFWGLVAGATALAVLRPRG